MTTHTCIHAHMHTCIHAYMHTCIHAYMHTCIHAYMHTCMYAFMHTCIHAFMHSSIHPFMYSSVSHTRTAQHKHCGARVSARTLRGRVSQKRPWCAVQDGLPLFLPRGSSRRLLQLPSHPSRTARFSSLWGTLGSLCGHGELALSPEGSEGIAARGRVEADREETSGCELLRLTEIGLAAAEYVCAGKDDEHCVPVRHLAPYFGRRLHYVHRLEPLRRTVHLFIDGTSSCRRNAERGHHCRSSYLPARTLLILVRSRTLDVDVHGFRAHSVLEHTDATVLTNNVPLTTCRTMRLQAMFHRRFQVGNARQFLVLLVNFVAH